jgi:V8-like Glu-specific endopeptidase
MPRSFAPRIAFATTAALAFAAPLAAQQQPPPSERLDYVVDSGWHEAAGAVPTVVISFPVVVEGARWMRLEFADVDLAGDVLAGDGATLRITSLIDGAVQELNAISVEQWARTSAYFNGEAVQVDVVAFPGTGASRVVLGAVVADISGGIPESICGPTDDRTLSSDARAGRILSVGCTGWLIDDCAGCALTAGHCMSAGATGLVLQFNVPLSSSSGGLNHPGPQDQYSIDPNSIQSNGGQGTGNDWAYFGTFPNSTTGLTAYQAQGARFTLAAPPTFNPAQTIRITGYGTRSSPPEWNQVQETHVGPWVTSSGSLLQYQTDTTGGNSGSPVIHEQSGNAIGIHTHGGCTSTGGQNSGTASSHSGLQGALAVPIGVCAASITPSPAPPATLQAGVPTQVNVQVGGPFVADSVTLHYRYDGGAFVAQAMSAGGGGLFSGTLPAPACDDTPEFYFSVQNPSCGILTSPAGAPGSFYSAAVAGVAVDVFADNFQTDKGWTAANLGATSGDWQRGVPVNDPSWAYDPTSDSDGSGSCFLTQNALGNTDVDNGAVQLTSPALNLAGGDCEIRYDYFLRLTVADGVDRLLVEASSNGLAGPWMQIASHTTDGGLAWRSHTVTEAALVAAGVAFTTDVRVRFTANDSGTQSIVEAGVDAFRVVRLSCQLFQNYCTSGALGSVISATGSSSIAANDLSLHASQIPEQKVGIFYYSYNQANAPFGNGTRCVGSPAVRLPMVSSGTGTTLDFDVDYNSLPSNGTIVAGSVWNFQAWFRDGVGPFDLSDGLRITFVP